LFENGVVEIFWDKSIELIEVKHLKKMQEIVSEIGGGKKMPILFAPHEFVHIDSEGQNYATSDEGVIYTKAVAVLVTNLAMRILMNFFLKTSNQKVPTKGFPTREEAMLWLETFVK
jgi:hypothetical protein